MSSEQPQKPAGPWSPLPLAECRVLGVLVEKAKTTPDAYPLSVNSMVAGSNQKSNRDPLMNLSEMEVEETLGRLLRRGLVERIQGGRVERWRHLLYAAWSADKVELAILAELLLRGPQTEGELRGRASRMEPIDDLDTLKSRLRPLVERKLVIYLTAEDRRGALLTHGFHEPGELERLKSRAISEPIVTSIPSVSVAAVDSSGPVQREIAELKATVADLQSAVSTLQEEVRGLRQSLGG